MRILTVVTSLVVGVVLASTSQAQTSFGPPPTRVPAFRGFPFGYRGHASTYEEGVLRGRAAVINARGQYNYLTSAAMINREHARNLALDNRVKYVATYFKVKEINRDERAKARRPAATSAEPAQLAKAKLPNRLTLAQYSPAEGKVFWPALLADRYFDFERTAIDKLIAERTPRNSGVGSENHRQMERQVAVLAAKLRPMIRTLSPSEYMSAKTFLDSLKYESRLPIEAPAALAAR